MKNFLAALFFIIITVSCQKNNPDTLSLVHYIPADSPVVIKINNLSLLKSELINNDFIKEITQTSFYNDFTSALKSTGYFTAKNEALFCFNEIGKQNFEYAMITKYRKNLFPADSLKGKKIDTIQYDGAEIKRITTNGETFFTTIIDSVFIASSSQLLAENIIRQSNVSDVNIDETFYKLYKTSDPKKSATVFINNTKIKLLADVFFENNTSKQIRDFADWTTIELSVSPDAVAYTGIAMAKPATSKIVNVFNGTLPQENLTHNITPVTASGFISFTFNNYTRLRSNLTTYNSNKAPKAAGGTKNDTIFKWVNEIGLIFEGENKTIIAHTLDMESTKNFLTDSSEPVSEFRGIQIYQHNNPQLFTPAFSPLINNIPIKYYAFTDNFMVSSETLASVQNIITHHQNKTTLGYSESFKDFISGLSNEASVLMVGLHPGFKTALQKNISENYKKDITAINLKNYPYFAFQVINDRDFAHIASIIKKTAVKNKDNTIAQLFSIILDADVAAPPQFVVNHRTKQKEIVVQDIENTLYLISNAGKVRWKKKLGSSIQGKIQQVDLYKNGRLQLAFVTRHKLHIIDRNGSEVAPFPINFTDNISQPLAVFDYDKNKNYRFLVCRGKKLSMYNGRGETVTGFTLTQTQSRVLAAPKHFRIGTKDYLVLPEENGKLHILHRTGKTRINVNRNINFSENTIWLYHDKFTVTDKEGRLIQIDEKGGIAVKNLNLEENHQISTTAKTLVTLSDNVLTIKGKKVMLDFGFYTPPRIFLINNKIYITVTDTQTNKVYMYDSNAALLPHFPVYGMSPADLDDIDNDKKLEFTVQGDKNAILLYKIN